MASLVACTISRPSMMRLPVTCAVNSPNSAMKRQLDETADE
jgi:hypothetical protein